MLTVEEIDTIGEVVENRVKKQLKPVNRKINKLQKDIELVLKYHDEMYIKQRTRIERLEQHTGINTY